MLMIVVTIRYLWRIYTVLRFGPPDTEIGALISGEETKWSRANEP
jgi:hypothetical protein